MNLKIRNAIPDDCYAIVSIIKNSLGYDNSPALIRDNLERILSGNNDLVMIAEYEDKAVGIVYAQDYNTIYSPPQKDLLSLQFPPSWNRYSTDEAY